MNKYESKYFRTALKMDKALIEILEVKDFEYITVKEICTKAQVNRSTFYLHYNNTVDLLEETKKYLENEFLSYFSLNRKAIENDNFAIMFQTCSESELNYISDKYLHPFLNYISDNKRVFLTVLSHSKPFNCDGTFEKMFEHIFDPILSRFQYPEKHRKFIILFYLNGIISIVTEWLADDCKESIPEISKVIKTCIYGRYQSFESQVSNSRKKAQDPQSD